ncbi:MAG: hypothetical protein N4R51_02255 [Lactobacillus crispatus]|nr:hypothetical protein [Lactobacillus crispatus]
MKMFFLANSILQDSLNGVADGSVIVGAILAFILLVRLINAMKKGESKKVNSSLIGIICVMLAVILALLVLGRVNLILFGIIIVLLIISLITCIIAMSKLIDQLNHRR